VYIRKVKSRGSTCFQIGKKQQGKFMLVKHIGCAASPAAIEALKIKAREELKKHKYLNQLSLLPDTDRQEAKAELLDWKITGFHRFFGPIYDSIGFPKNFLRDLVITRVVYPKSKLATARYMTRTLDIPATKDKIYRFMDTMSKKKLSKIARSFVSSKNKGISVIFYDVTTLYFETDKEDEVRQKGFSKDHRRDVPQILIGLFVDKDGYPFDYDYFEGKTFEGHTFIRAVNSLLQKHSFKDKDLTIVADAGMLSNDNLSFLESKQLSYIVAARLKNLPQKIIKNILSQDFLSSPTYETSYQGKRLIVDYSSKRAKKDQHNRKRLIKALKTKLSKKQTVIRKSKYLKVSGKEKAMGIDQEKIKQDRQFDGLKGYLSNHLSLLPGEISQQYRNLWQVEKAFRMSKSDLKERPVYHQKEKRIASHLLLCFCSLLVIKQSEKLLKKTGQSLNGAIELLADIGEGKASIGKVQIPIEKKPGEKVKKILKIIKGH